MQISFCLISEIGEVMQFIHSHWRPNHILSKNIELINYQHLDTVNDRYNYVIARNEAGGIEGLLGFIINSKFDSKLNTNNTIWLSLWKTIEKASPLIGINMLKFLEGQIEHEIIGTLGISNEANKIFKILNYNTGQLVQYYIPNQTIDSFIIAKTPVARNNGITEATGVKYEITEIDLQDFDSSKISHKFKPEKSIAYLKEKYVKHPFYNYTLLGNERVNLIIVGRVININNAFVYRIVDVIGDLNNLPLMDLQSFVIKKGFEYIDFLHYGNDEKIFIDSGFSKLDIQDNTTIVPMYFEPFIQLNSSIRFAYKTNLQDPILLFKADADQDRPNKIKG